MHAHLPARCQKRERSKAKERAARDSEEQPAVQAFNLASAKLLVALDMLVAVRTGELQFAHSFSLIPRFVSSKP